MSLASSITVKHKRALAARWTLVDPTLAAGEFGVETDTNKFKIGDGTTPWSGLAYAGGGSTSYQIDGGLPDSVYGGTTPIDGGTI
jgi:hypothetical protein